MKNVLFLIASLFFVGCGPKNRTDDNNTGTHLTESKNGKFILNVTWIEGPYGATGAYPEEYYSKAKMEFLRFDKKQPVSVEVLKVHPWMKIHGHGTDVVPKVNKIEANIFELSDVYFTMLGPWELNVTAKVDGYEDTIEVKVETIKKR